MNWEAGRPPEGVDDSGCCLEDLMYASFSVATPKFPKVFRPTLPIIHDGNDRAFGTRAMSNELATDRGRRFRGVEARDA